MHDEPIFLSLSALHVPPFPISCRRRRNVRRNAFKCRKGHEDASTEASFRAEKPFLFLIANVVRPIKIKIYERASESEHTRLTNITSIHLTFAQLLNYIRLHTNMCSWNLLY